MKDLQKESFIFGSLFVLANRVQNLGDKADPVLSIKQWLLIAAISQCGSENPTISEIAKVIGSSRQNVKKMAALLEKIGFVRLQRDDNDARAIRVSPTERCAEHFRIYEKAEIEFIEKLFDGFSDDQLGGLYEGLRKLSENVIKMENEETDEDEKE